MIQLQTYQSPCGDLLLGAYGDRLCLCDWPDEARRKLIDERIRKGLHADYAFKASEVLVRAMLQLDEYFNQKRRTFDLPLLLVGTDFQQAVWNKLLEIPYGTTISYARLSQRLGNIKAIRAVAAANGANALSIFIPCHRVVGSDNKLTGYAGGLAAKRYLLDLESPGLL